MKWSMKYNVPIVDVLATGVVCKSNNFKCCFIYEKKHKLVKTAGFKR